MTHGGNKKSGPEEDLCCDCSMIAASFQRKNYLIAICTASAVHLSLLHPAPTLWRITPRVGGGCIGEDVRCRRPNGVRTFA